VSGRRPPAEALVFDFDGLILDTEGPVFTAWQEEFVAHGCPPLTIEEWSAEIGTSGGLDLVDLIRTRATRPFDEQKMHARRRERRDELLSAETARPGVLAWLDASATLGLRVAIASSSESEWVEPLLERLGIRDRFDHVACYGRGLAAKPAPDTYRAACAAVGVEPNAAIAIEDSPHGVAAAKAAGLWCVAVPHAITEVLDLTQADLVLRSLADVSLRDVLGTRAGDSG
jgi:beta-phosphoglucomutase-like phosphatase (HAD superfamily)